MRSEANGGRAMRAADEGATVTAFAVGGDLEDPGDLRDVSAPGLLGNAGDIVGHGYLGDAGDIDNVGEFSNPGLSRDTDNLAALANLVTLVPSATWEILETLATVATLTAQVILTILATLATLATLTTSVAQTILEAPVLRERQQLQPVAFLRSSRHSTSQNQAEMLCLQLEAQLTDCSKSPSPCLPHHLWRQRSSACP
ncbi:hypothetical protein TREES_T100016307 [Tupaia chinensis]|uniref:Uncharacterized protein n=1 Tax=Tupaia chinensis TaxID=246437 RepID=L9JCM0_TUPCH|nr:hypothetical protein TREES_T100016307 [Tupaia chinensis]